MQTITLRGLTGRKVAIRTEAAQTCYSSVGQVLLPSPTAPQTATVVGHGGIGIVEAVGPEVHAIQVGDRVIANFHCTCGWCYNCVRGPSGPVYERRPGDPRPTWTASRSIQVPAA